MSLLDSFKSAVSTVQDYFNKYKSLNEIKSTVETFNTDNVVIGGTVYDRNIEPDNSALIAATGLTAPDYSSYVPTGKARDAFGKGWDYWFASGTDLQGNPNETFFGENKFKIGTGVLLLGAIAAGVYYIKKRR